MAHPDPFFHPSDERHAEASDEPQCPARRRFIKQLGLSTVALATLGASGCGLFDEPEMQLGPLDDLKAEGHWIHEFNGDLIFTALNDEGQPYTLSLICSHKQCTVEYFPEQTQFICPCHKGEYTKAGTVISGKPPKPLRQFQTEIREGSVWVLNTFVRDW